MDPFTVHGLAWDPTNPIGYANIPLLETLADSVNTKTPKLTSRATSALAAQAGGVQKELRTLNAALDAINGSDILGEEPSQEQTVAQLRDTLHVMDGVFELVSQDGAMAFKCP